MKKTWVFLIVLGLVAVSAPLFADAPVVKGTFMYFGNWDFSATPIDSSRSGPANTRVKVDTMVDKNNEVYIELRGEGNFAFWNVAPFGTDFKLYNFKATSDLTKSLGMDMPVDVKLTVGYWDTYFTNWWYADTTGWDFYYGGANPTNLTGLTNAGANFSNKLVWAQPAKGGYQFDVGMGDGAFTLHYFNAFDLNTVLLGADASFMGFGVYVSYGMYNIVANGAAKGDLSVEAKYDVPEMMGVKLSVYPFFRYSLDSTTAATAANKLTNQMTYGASLAANVGMIRLAAGIQGDDAYVLDHWFWEASIAPVDGSKIWVNGYFDQALPTNTMAGIDFGASYKFGAANVLIGYLYGGPSITTVPLYGDNPAFHSGLYAGIDLPF